MRKIILRSLQAVGVTEVTEAADGNEAIAMFQPGQFDMVLTDWNMPGKTGLEVVQEIRAQDAKVPIIMVTTEAEKGRVMQAIQAGVSDYLVKPFTADTLARKAHQTRLLLNFSTAEPICLWSVTGCRPVLLMKSFSPEELAGFVSASFFVLVPCIEAWNTLYFVGPSAWPILPSGKFAILLTVHETSSRVEMQFKPDSCVSYRLAMNPRIYFHHQKEGCLLCGTPERRDIPLFPWRNNLERTFWAWLA